MTDTTAAPPSAPQTVRQFIEGAQGELTEAGADTDRPKYEKTITVTVAAETAKLLSLKRVDFDYSGGAHPNTLTDGLLWDKALKRRVSVADLFGSAADLTVLDADLLTIDPLQTRAVKVLRTIVGGVQRYGTEPA